MKRLPAEFDSTTILLNAGALREVDPALDVEGMRVLDPMESLHGIGAIRGGGTVEGGGRRSAYIPPDPFKELCWNARYKIEKHLGAGAQGSVYLANREGADGYTTRVALKIYYHDPRFARQDYVAEMQRIALQGQRISRIQHDNLINIRDFVSIDDTRVMVLEWIDGVDLAQLLDLASLEALRARLSKEEWERLNDVVVTAGEDHCRLKPGIAVDILRGCLAGLSALHQEGIAHCDLKPSNIMVKRAGIKKIIDIDSSCVVEEEPQALRGTPYYMAPEQLEERKVRLRSDIASLGYILIEMLTGRLLFRRCTTLRELLEAKLRLPDRLDALLPREARDDPILSGLVHKMVAIDPRDRFPDADAADLGRVGAARFHRHLVQNNLSTEYNRELSWWIGTLMGAAADPPERQRPESSATTEVVA